MTEKKERVPVKTQEEFEAQLAAGIAETEVDVDTGAPDDLYFENGPLAGTRIKAKDLQNSDDDETPEADKPEEGAEGETPPAAKVEPVVETPVETPVVETPAAVTPETPVVATPAYQPETTYKVYDEVRQFPDWAKAVATSKETEENLRTTLQKSDAFDALKPKHTEVVRERDTAKSHVEEHIAKTQRLIELRDKDPGLFFHKMGVSPESLITFTAELAYKKQNDPDGYNRMISDIKARADQEEQFEAQRVSTASAATTLAQQHAMAEASAFAQPDVSSFKSQMDKVYGDGAFERAFRQYGSHVIQTEKRYIAPADVARWVMSNYVLPQATPSPVVATPTPVAATPVPQQATPAPQAHVAPVAAPKPPRVKTLPNVGRGSGNSPVARKPKSFAELEKVIEADM